MSIKTYLTLSSTLAEIDKNVVITSDEQAKKVFLQRKIKIQKYS